MKYFFEPIFIILGRYYFAAQITAIMKPLNCLLTLLLFLAINNANAELTKGTTRRQAGRVYRLGFHRPFAIGFGSRQCLSDQDNRLCCRQQSRPDLRAGAATAGIGGEE